MGLLRCEVTDLGLDVLGVAIEEGALIGTVYQTGPCAWRWDLWDADSGIVAFAGGLAVTPEQAQVELVGAAIDRVIETIF